MSAQGRQCRARCHFWSCTADCAAAPLAASGTGQGLEGHLGDNQSLRSSAFKWGTENCKEIWQGSRSIPNKGLATRTNTCKAALRAECFQQRQLTKIHFTTGTKFLLFQHTANSKRYSFCSPGRLHWTRFKLQADTTNLFNRIQTNPVPIFTSAGATENILE